MPSAMSTTWQCVLVCWGTKYNDALIDNLIWHIDHLAKVKPTRFVLITDRPRPTLRAQVHVVDMPSYWQAEPLKRGGCQAKLCMFESGVVPPDMPALYVDLDTVVLGDLSRAVQLLTTPHTVALLHSALIPFGVLGRAIYRLTRGKHYPKGNSSFVLYHPAHTAFIAEQFRLLYQQFPDLSYRPLIADERFISWVSYQTVRAFPKDFVVKLTSEYMFPWTWWLLVRAALPWVKRRRRCQAAVTLNGPEIKPSQLALLPEGAKVVDNKSRVLLWSEPALGHFQEQARRFFKGATPTPKG